MKRLAHGLACVALVLAGGCAIPPDNPSFAVSPRAAESVLDACADHPKPLDRPLVIIGGFVDPGFAATMLRWNFESLTGDQRIVSVPLGFDTNFTDYRRRIIDAVQAAFPSADAQFTTDVDVIGYSMGGLAARYSAMPARGAEPARRLRIHRLFTISSPLRGARVAIENPVLLPPLQTDLQPGSRFMASFDQGFDTDTFYSIYSYVCLGDKEVGPENAAAPGQSAWWITPPFPVNAHDWAFMDPRIRADILLRLRDETPLTLDPPSALPTN